MLAICLTSKQNSSELLGGSHYLLKDSIFARKKFSQDSLFPSN